MAKPTGILDYLIGITFPPLYFLLKKAWVALGVTTTLFIIGLAFWWTIIIPIVLYVPCAIVAVVDAQKRLMREHAADIANQLAQKTIGGQPRE